MCLLQTSYFHKIIWRNGIERRAELRGAAESKQNRLSLDIARKSNENQVMTMKLFRMSVVVLLAFNFETRRGEMLGEVRATRVRDKNYVIYHVSLLQ